jgi:hypothetical protein
MPETRIKYVFRISTLGSVVEARVVFKVESQNLNDILMLYFLVGALN